MTIYNKKLTNELIECFGEEVLQWNKSTIRTNLEDSVIRMAGLVLDTKDTIIRNIIHSSYEKIKRVDNDYTTEYMNQIEKIVKV